MTLGVVPPNNTVKGSKPIFIWTWHHCDKLFNFLFNCNFDKKLQLLISSFYISSITTGEDIDYLNYNILDMTISLLSIICFLMLMLIIYRTSYYACQGKGGTQTCTKWEHPKFTSHQMMEPVKTKWIYVHYMPNSHWVMKSP